MNDCFPVVMVVGLQGCSSMFAATEHSHLREEISRRIAYPDFARAFHLEGVVHIDFNTDSDGQVSVSGSTGSHEGLMEYVRNRIGELVLPAGESGERRYRLMLKFRMY
ncbi:MAG: hypothetical protein JNL22_10825 [Bacteroidales bacterium]|nr:hypothetical protein [Bacteroidales bacterium]